MTNAQILYKELLDAQHIYIMPMGEVGRYVYDSLNKLDICVEAFLDNNRQAEGKEYKGCPCFFVDHCRQSLENAIVIVASKYYADISEQLLSLGTKKVIALSRYKIDFMKYFTDSFLDEYKRQVLSLKEILSDDQSRVVVDQLVNVLMTFDYNKEGYKKIESVNQYFDSEIIKCSNDEVFVDVGAYDGDTIEGFLKFVNNKYKGIIAYEIDNNAYSVLKEKYWNVDKIKLVNKGLYSFNGEVSFDSDTICSDISDSGYQKGYVSRLDDDLDGMKVTFLKMDIEGSEMQALLGAKETIKKFKPKLAIAIYHKPEDLYEIPKYIKKLVPEYRLYIRHYNSLEYETVLYAV